MKGVWLRTAVNDNEDIDKRTCGSIVAIDSTILSLYADDIDSAMLLLRDWLNNGNIGGVTASMHIVCDSQLASMILSAESMVSITKRREVNRYHTRSLPADINWANVYVPNIGMHLL